MVIEIFCLLVVLFGWLYSWNVLIYDVYMCFLKNFINMIDVIRYFNVIKIVFKMVYLLLSVVNFLFLFVSVLLLLIGIRGIFNYVIYI